MTRLEAASVWVMRRLMRDTAWCHMAGWRLHLGQACTMTTVRGKPEFSTGTHNLSRGR